MLQITPQVRILVAVEPVDLRKGSDGLAELCREKLQADPFSGWLFVFRGLLGLFGRNLSFISGNLRKNRI